MTRAELEALRDDIDRALVLCIVCGESGALVVRARLGDKKGVLDVCEPCWAKHRRPDREATAA